MVKMSSNRTILFNVLERMSQIHRNGNLTTKTKNDLLHLEGTKEGIRCIQYIINYIVDLGPINRLHIIQSEMIEFICNYGFICLCRRKCLDLDSTSLYCNDYCDCKNTAYVMIFAIVSFKIF